MRIFVAGASGAIGLPLVRLLSGAGHEVTGSTRGQAAALYATRGCAASNARIREETGWSPSITSWRDGFMTSI